jgi:hypothetical protein
VEAQVMTPSHHCGDVDVQRTAAGAGSASETRSVSSRLASGPLPLSVSQSGLWYVSQLAPDSPAYNELIMIRKTGPFEVEALRRALTEVVARHGAWRTTFKTVDGVPHQFVGEPAEVDLPLTDLSDLDPEGWNTDDRT